MVSGSKTVCVTLKKGSCKLQKSNLIVVVKVVGLAPRQPRWQPNSSADDSSDKDNKFE